MSEPKTRPTDASVSDHIAKIAHQGRRSDAMSMDEMMRSVSGESPVMWGSSIVGYGERARDGQPAWPVIAFAARTSELVLYLDADVEPALFEALGPHRRGVGCVYLKRLADVDRDSLLALLQRSVELARR